MDSIQGITRPVIGLAPMDGVTDCAYRVIQKKYGGPDLLFTEFVNVVGLCRGAEKLFADLRYLPQEHPIIAQLFGHETEYFYHAAKIIVALGFDGIDINMGCPARNVAERGSGAALINQPKLAVEIIRAVQKGVHDYLETGELTGVASKVPTDIATANSEHGVAVDTKNQAQNFTISVKTRTGYKEDTVTSWVQTLSEARPHWISVHGRTLKQMYSGAANWDSLAQAVAATDLPVFVNGDVDTSNKSVAILKHTQAAGVLIGRASFGNPWIFKQKAKIKDLQSEINDYIPKLSERSRAMLDHAQLHWVLKGERGFLQMRKNLAMYVKNLPNAAQVRTQLVQVNNPEEAKNIIDKIHS